MSTNSKRPVGYIQFRPDSATSRKIDTLAKQLRLSKPGFAGLAVDFLLPLLESGKARVVNGQIEIIELPKQTAA